MEYDAVGGLRYVDAADGPAVALPRGDVTEGVVRIGSTVRRPGSVHSGAVAAYLHHLEAQGFNAAPRYLGVDDDGRDTLTFLAGEVAGDPPEPWAADPDLLASVARLVRRLHQASAGFRAAEGFTAPEGSVWSRDAVPVEGLPPDPAPELVSHNDVTPQNVVVRDNRAVGLIDFDLAGPTTLLLDAYNTAMHWVPLRDPADVWPTWRGVDQMARLRVFAEAYGLTGPQRGDIVDLGIVRADASWLRMRARAERLGGGWARMWDEGVGELIRRRKAWLAAMKPELKRALR